MAVDDRDGVPESVELVGERFAALLSADPIALGELVAVEDGDYVGQGMIDDEIECFPDLPLAGLAVAHDAVEVAIELVGAGCGGEAGGDGETLPE